MFEPVLVLNANFEPIHVCNTRRAIGLILTGKANLVLNGRGEIKTVSLSLPRPSIIRLSHMVKRPRPKVRLTKREILRRDEYTCQYCGQHVSILTIDHVIPRRMGGTDTWENSGHRLPGMQSSQRGQDVGSSTNASPAPSNRAAGISHLSFCQAPA